MRSWPACIAWHSSLVGLLVSLVFSLPVLTFVGGGGLELFLLLLHRFLFVSERQETKVGQVGKWKGSGRNHD